MQYAKGIDDWGDFIKYVIAIGGNAITNAHVLSGLSVEIGRLARKGDQILVTHGNGPQVGELLLEEGRSLALLTAQTEAEIGLEVQESIEKAGHVGKVAIVITRVLVNPRDREFRFPTKPVGRFYSKAEADIGRRNDHAVRKLIGGYRVVVPSPDPIEILDLEHISSLLESGHVVIAGGGGGVAVARGSNGLRYLDAVLDKDKTSALLASRLHADRFIILTNIDAVYLGYGKRNQKRIARAAVAEMEEYIREKEFEPGSMLPKVEACISFIRSGGNYAAIGSLDEARGVIGGRSGSIITP